MFPRRYFGSRYFGEGYFGGGDSELVLDVSSVRSAGVSAAVGVVTPAAVVTPPQTVARAPAGGVGKPRRKARQHVYTWPALKDLEPVRITATAKSVGAPGESHARLTWLKVIKGRATSATRAGRSAATAEMVDIELQEFMALALRLAA